MPSDSKKPKMYLGVTVQMLLNLGMDWTLRICIGMTDVHGCPETLN